VRLTELIPRGPMADPASCAMDNMFLAWGKVDGVCWWPLTI